MEQKFIKITDKNEWQVLLDKVLFKTFFHFLEWEEFLEKSFKWLKFERYVYNEECLLSLARVGGKLISHPFCEYGGPLPLTEKIDGEFFRRDLFSEFKGCIRISFHPQLLDYFGKTALEDSGRVSYLLEDQQNLRKTTRHEIEKAQVNNIQVEKCQSEKDLRNFYNLHVKGAKRHKIPAYPFSFFQYFLNSKESEVVLAEKENKIIAGSVFLFYGRFIHYFQNAIDEKHKNLGANHLILWRQIQKCFLENKIFDFGGTRQDSSLQVFKRGWGGEEHPIFELENYQSSGFRDSKLRNIFGLLPPFFIKKLSPSLLKYKL